MIPPCMLPTRRKTKAEQERDNRLALAKKIMDALERHKPKRKRPKR